MDVAEFRKEHDCLYGEIYLPAILWKIINTREFQRLRRIKQLGGVEYVYKDASHTRYQHSIGTAYLAGLIAKRLQKHYHTIDERDILRVQIAALCHDLGHGPFSFTFREKVVPRLGISSWEHKDLAYEIFVKIWETVVTDDPEIRNFLSANDMSVIKELIQGTSKGQSVTKDCLHKIFSNSDVEWDMCKFDYMARDCLQFGNLDAKLYVDLKSIGTCDLLYRDVNGTIHPFPIFLTNLNQFKDLHMEAYQNPNVNAVEHMISDAIVLAFESPSLGSDIPDSYVDFICELDDGILSVIRSLKNDSDLKLAEAKQILNRLDRGQYYGFAKGLKLKQSQVQDILENISQRASVMANQITTDMLKRTVVRKSKTLGCVADDEELVQVFCTDPHKVEAVRCACQQIEEELQKQS